MRESTAWAELRAALKEEAASRHSNIDLVRVENMVGSGVFDCNACYRGVEFWMEGKYLMELPKRHDSKVKFGLRDEQRTWALKRLAVGGKLFLWVRVGGDLHGPGFGWYLVHLNSPDTVNNIYNGVLKSAAQLYRCCVVDKDGEHGANRRTFACMWLNYLDQLAERVL